MAKPKKLMDKNAIKMEKVPATINFENFSAPPENFSMSMYAMKIGPLIFFVLPP